MTPHSNSTNADERQRLGPPLMNDNVLYHSLLGLGTMQQVSGSVLRPSEASAFVNTCRLCVSDWRFTCWRLEFSSQVVPTPLRSGELRQVRARRRIPHPERCHAAGQLHLGKQ